MRSLMSLMRFVPLTTNLKYIGAVIGARISERRRFLGTKQVDLAAEMGNGVDRSTVSKIETGAKKPSLCRGKDPARALNASLDWLVGLTDDPTPAADLSQRLAKIDRHARSIRIVGDVATGDPRRRRREER